MRPRLSNLIGFLKHCGDSTTGIPRDPSAAYLVLSPPWDELTEVAQRMKQMGPPRDSCRRLQEEKMRKRKKEKEKEKKKEWQRGAQEECEFLIVCLPRSTWWFNLLFSDTSTLRFHTLTGSSWGVSLSFLYPPLILHPCFLFRLWRLSMTVYIKRSPSQSFKFVSLLSNLFLFSNP